MDGDSENNEFTLRIFVPTMHPLNPRHQNVTPSALDMKEQNNFDEKVYTTLISLFLLIGVPVLFVLANVLWHLWTMMCDKLEAAISSEYEFYDRDHNTFNECSQPQVARILFALPPDFDFKHVCDSKRTIATPTVTVI